MFILLASCVFLFYPHHKGDEYFNTAEEYIVMQCYELQPWVSVLNKDYIVWGNYIVWGKNIMLRKRRLIENVDPCM